MSTTDNINVNFYIASLELNIVYLSHQILLGNVQTYISQMSQHFQKETNGFKLWTDYPLTILCSMNGIPFVCSVKRSWPKTCSSISNLNMKTTTINHYHQHYIKLYFPVLPPNSLIFFLLLPHNLLFILQFLFFN